MAVYDFYKGTYSQLTITITSNEVLGILDTDYIEDYDGVDGQISLYHPASGVRYSVLMSAIVPAQQFRGYFALATAPLGRYEVQGRVRDLAGNETVMGGQANGPQTTPLILELEIKAGTGPNTGGIITAEGLDLDQLVFSLSDYNKPLILTGRNLW